MKKETKQYEVLHWASLFLSKHNCDENIAEILLQHHLQVTRSGFYMDMQKPVQQSVIHKLKRDLEKHVQTGVPVQHLLGYEAFYGRKFLVNKHVLIPRPETEELVQCTIDRMQQPEINKRPIIVDVGTGSGVIATTLALEIPQATIYATDISRQALQIARENAERLEAEVTFLEGDFLKPIKEADIQVDILVSNPPYIAETERESLSKTVKDFDPSLALFAEDNGLAAYQEILKLSTNVMKPGAIILFEIGFQQAEAISTFIKQTYPQSDVQIVQDINKKDRIIITQLQ